MDAENKPTPDEKVDSSQPVAVSGGVDAQPVVDQPSQNVSTEPATVDSVPVVNTAAASEPTITPTVPNDAINDLQTADVPNQAPPKFESSVDSAPLASTPGAVVIGSEGQIQPVVTPSKSFKNKKWLKIFLISLAALAVIGGGSAAAYFKVIVPNQPEYILVTSVVNSLQQDRVSFAGKVSTQPVNSIGIASDTAFSGQFDAAKTDASLHLGLTVSGVALDAEARYVGGDVYVRLGDLKNILPLLKAFSPEYAAIVQSLNSKLSNNWIKIDSTILKSAGAGCTLDTKLSLTDADTKLLETQYRQHRFATVTSATNDTVDGKKVVKYEVSMDNDKAAAFVNQLGSLSAVKAIQKCNKDSSKKLANSSLADHDHTPLTVWIDKGSKRIVKISSHSSDQDAKKSNLKANGSITLNYDKPVSIVAPAKSTSVLELLGAFQGGLPESPSSSTGTNPFTLQ